MKKRSASHDLGTVPSPGSQYISGAGWASERVPRTALVGPGRGGAERQMGLASGRAVPSKWDDAERWICSPLGTTPASMRSHQPRHRPKSKSGPIAQCTPTSLPISPEFKISLLSESSSNEEEELNPSSVSRGVSQRDMATQMSPRDCKCCHVSVAVRDVEIDDEHDKERRGYYYDVIKELSENGFDISREKMDDSRRWKREEAKITAWENLQNAKAEAAIRKLEMKLERKKSATIDKIVDKLRAAEFKAQKMRSNLSDDLVHNLELCTVLRTPTKLLSFPKRVWLKSLTRIFTCRAF